MIIDGTNGLTFNNATTQASAGVVLQVVQGTYSTQTSSSSSTYADTGLSASITPKFSTSKVLVLVCHAEVQKENGTQVGLKLQKNGSDLYTPFQYAFDTNSASRLNSTLSFCYLDAPATTSAITYKTQYSNRQAGSTTVYMQADNTLATMTLMEIAQ
jgi:hypothetical protein